MVSIFNALGVSQADFDKFLDSDTAKGILDIEEGQCSISLTDYRNSGNDFYQVYESAYECYNAFVEIFAHWEKVAATNPSYRIKYPTGWEEYSECVDDVVFHPGHALVVYHKGKKEKYYYMVNPEYE